MHLTKSEQQAMAAFWASDHPMTQAQLVENCPNRSWNERTVFLILNQLLSKGLIRIVGFERCGRSYARTFEATGKQWQFWEKVITEQLPPSFIPDFLCATLRKNTLEPRILQEIYKTVNEGTFSAENRISKQDTTAP